MAKIDSAYNYLLSTYSDNLKSNRYDSHKKSELRSVYNKIVKTNKESPLYKIADSEEVAKFAIDIKATAQSAQNTISALSYDGDSIASMMNRKEATSSDKSKVAAEYIGDGSDETKGFSLEIDKLAQPQINRGNFLDPNGRAFQEGSYSFDLESSYGAFEFQFNVNEGDTNLDVQSKISRLVNQSDVGLKSNVVYNDRGRSALEITSKQTGLDAGKTQLFKISSNTSFNEIRALGINQITQEASNSAFKLNGNEHSSLSNTFTINNAFELTLVEPTDSPVQVGFKTNIDALSDGVNNLIDSYNGLLEVGRKYSTAGNNNKLFNEVMEIGNSNIDSLSSAGITMEENGRLALNKAQLQETINNGDAEKAFDGLNKFKSALEREAEKTTINPMDYVNKVIVEYKNPGKTFNYPYAPSAYAGMLVDKAL